MKTQRKNKKRWTLFITSFILLLIVFLLIGYMQGFRITKSGIAYPSMLIVSGGSSDIKVFIDSKVYKIKENKDSKIEQTVQNIPAGIHDVVFAKKGFWPWMKRVTLLSKETKTLSPFFLPQSSQGEIIPPADPEYDSLINRIYDNILPSEENPKISNDQKVAIWSDGKDIFAKWLGVVNEMPEAWCADRDKKNCPLTLKVTHSVSDIKNLDFYKNRSDVVLFSADTSLYALEIAKEGTQNFEPAYSGVNPFFVLGADQTVYLREKEQLLHFAI